MRAVVYRRTGGPEVLEVVERPVGEPAPGEVRVRVEVSGVNPTDWKARRGASFGGTGGAEVVPHHDGAGVVEAVGSGVTELSPGQRVWVWEAAWQRTEGTAQEYVVLPARQVVPLPDSADLDLGASLGIRALTAHRCLTTLEGGPERLAPGTLTGRTVLVAGGAGAVGHAATQLARWAGARVVATASTAAKAELARRAGAHDVVDYRARDAAEQVRRQAPRGVDLVVEVAPGVNADLDAEVVAPGATVAVYAQDGGEPFVLPVRRHLFGNTRFQMVLVYTMPAVAKEYAVAAVSDAVADGALTVGREAGLPLHRFPLERTAEAHTAVESGVVGKVLVDVV